MEQDRIDQEAGGHLWPSGWRKLFFSCNFLFLLGKETGADRAVRECVVSPFCANRLVHCPALLPPEKKERDSLATGSDRLLPTN